MRISKKILAIALSILMAVSMMPFTVFAATANLSDILASASGKYVEITDTDIVVDADTTLTGHILDLYGNVSIDLNGHNLVAGAANSSGQEVAIWINPSANVTITDSAQPSTAATYSTTTGDLTIKSGVAAISSTYYGIINEGNLTLGKAVVKGDNNAICVTAGGTLTTTEANSIVCGGTYGVTYPGGNATLNLTKGMIFGQYGLSGNSSWDSANNTYKFGGNTINIGTAKIYGKGIDDEGDGVNGAAIVLGADDDCNITGNATIYGFNAPAIVTRASADLDITASPSVQTYGTLTNVKVLDGSTSVPCAPVVVDTACGYTKAADIDVDIENGTYKANIAGVENAVALVGESGEEVSDYVDVTTGTFTANGVADTSVPYDDTTYVQDDFGKLFNASDIGTTYNVEFTNAQGKKTWQTLGSTFSSDGTYKLLADATKAQRINTGLFAYNVVLDLNGHTLTANGTTDGIGILLSRAGTADNQRYFSVINTSETPAAINAKECIAITAAYNNLTIGENVTLNVENDFGITVNGSIKNTESAPTVQIDGTVNGDEAGIYAAGYANYVINGTVTGDTGIYQKGGNLVVNEGAVVQGKGADTDPVQNGSGMTATGEAITVEETTSHLYGSTVINGGTITSDNADAVGSYALEAATVAGKEAPDEIIPATSTATFSSDVSELTESGVQTDYDDVTDSYVIVAAHTVAKIGDVKYDSLEEAWSAAVDGDTITLVQDCNGNGLQAPQGKFQPNGLTVDFAGHTYTQDGTLVGSTGTQTQAFQLLKNNNITFKNGTITSTKAKMLIQNYSNLTLDNMTLTLNNPSYAYAYTLSNNNGDVTINDTEINANPAGGFAFDVCRYASYPSVNVTVTGDSVINGNVEVDASNGNAMDGFSLTLESGEMNGDIKVTNNGAAAIEATPEKADVTKEDTFTQEAPAGYEWVSNGDGTSSLEETADGVSITTADSVNVNIYINPNNVKAIRYTFNNSPEEEGNDQETITVPVSALTKNDDGQYQYSIVVAPAQIQDNITVEVIANNNTVKQTYITSVAGYCEQIIAGDYNANTKALAQAVLDYGKACAEFFDYNAAAFDDYSTTADYAFDASSMTAYASGIIIEEVRYRCVSVPELRFVVDMPEEIAATLTATTDKGYAAKFIKVEDKVVLEVTGIPAAKLDETITINVSNGSVIEYTPLAYAMVAARSNDPALANLGNYIGHYFAAAKAVFA